MATCIHSVHCTHHIQHVELIRRFYFRTHLNNIFFVSGPANRLSTTSVVVPNSSWYPTKGCSWHSMVVGSFQKPGRKTNLRSRNSSVWFYQPGIRSKPGTFLTTTARLFQPCPALLHNGATAPISMAPPSLPGYRTLSCGGHGSMPLEFAVFSPDAERVVTVARDGLVQSWDAVAGKLAQTLVDEGRLFRWV